MQTTKKLRRLRNNGRGQLASEQSFDIGRKVSKRAGC